MAVKGIPLGKLQSFGAIDFTTLSAFPDNDPPHIIVASDTNWITPNGRTFATPRTGLSGAAFKGAVLEWKYWLQAGAGLSEAASWQFLQDSLDTLYLSYWSNTTTYGGYTGVSGQANDLTAKDAYGVNRTAQAIWASFPYAMQPGDVNAYQVTLQFQLLEHFT